VAQRRDVLRLLALSWGGTTYPWSSSTIVGLGGGALGAVGLLTLNERRASEPLLPPRLFRSSVFILSVLVIGLAAMGMFAAAVFLPLYFQLVQGASPTAAGLMIAPMMGGVITASIGGGRLVSRTGRDCRKFWGVSAKRVFSRRFFDREWTRGLDCEGGENRR